MADIEVCTFDAKNGSMEDDDCSDHSDLGSLSDGEAEQLDENEEEMDNEALLKALECVEADIDDVGGAENDGVEVDGAENDGAEVGGAENDGAEVDGAENDGAEVGGGGNDGAAVGGGGVH